MGFDVYGKNPQLVGEKPEIDDLTDESKKRTREAYAAKVIEIAEYNKKINTIRLAAQEEEKRYIHKPEAVRLPNRSKEAGKGHETLHNINSDDIAYAAVKAGKKLDIQGIKGGAWHSDFKDAVFKNTLFKNNGINIHDIVRVIIISIASQTLIN